MYASALTASATYLVNDLLDIEADRRHPEKAISSLRGGGFASRDRHCVCFCLPRSSSHGGLVLAGRVFGAPGGISGDEPQLFAVSQTNSTGGRSFAFGTLYAIRLLAGGAAVGVAISPWLAGFSIFLFLSLAMVKRFSELQNVRARGHVPSNARGYLLVDLEQLRSFGTASAYASVVVFSLYISGHEVAALYRHPARMWLITPFMIPLGEPGVVVGGARGTGRGPGSLCAH